MHQTNLKAVAMVPVPMTRHEAQIATPALTTAAHARAAAGGRFWPAGRNGVPRTGNCCSASSDVTRQHYVQGTGILARADQDMPQPEGVQTEWALRRTEAPAATEVSWPWSFRPLHAAFE